MNKPELIHDNKIDLTDLKKQCQEYIDYLSSDDFHEDGDSKRVPYIFESAMKALFGKNVFDYINEQYDQI